MKDLERKKLVELFTNNNQLGSLVIPLNTQKVIAEAAAPLYRFMECLEMSGMATSTNPVDGILINWVNRVYQVVSGMLSLLTLEKFQQAEVLSRTVMESSLALLYIEQENTEVRIVQYLDSYLRQEMEQNRKWKKELESVPQAMKVDHLQRIEAKTEAIDSYELFIKIFAAKIGVSYPPQKCWLNFFEICSALNKAVDHRTVYAAMCSQSHHDAEDMLNDLMVSSIPNPNNLLAKLEREKNNFSLNLILCSIRYYLECLEQISTRFKFDSVVQQSKRSFIEITRLAEDVVSGGCITTPIDDWII